MIEIVGDILDVKEGFICHQVNCQNKIGAGLSGAIIAKYPIVKHNYHKFCDAFPKNDLLGKTQVISVSPNLFIVNIFTQYGYGNSAKTHINYTSQDLLVSEILKLCSAEENIANIYIPYKIGCGLAGGNWNYIYSSLERVDPPNLIIVRKE